MINCSNVELHVALNIEILNCFGSVVSWRDFQRLSPLKQIKKCFTLLWPLITPRNHELNRGIAVSLDGFGSISWHSVWFSSDGSFSFYIFFPDSNFFDLSITEETSVVEVHIWCIKIGNVLVLLLTPGSRPLLVDCKFPRISTAQ
jgi:hypothetical protein